MHLMCLGSRLLDSLKGDSFFVLFCFSFVVFFWITMVLLQIVSHCPISMVSFLKRTIFSQYF